MTHQFNRWASIEKSTWAFQALKSYNVELESMRISHSLASAFCYNQLSSRKAEWKDESKAHFTTSKIKEVNYFETLSDWKSGFHEFQNWVNLNAIMAMSSNFETYLSAVISQAITSDPGVLVGASKSVDGVYLLKHQRSKIDPADYVIACTKGDWSSRISSYESIFGQAPSELKKNRSDLDKIRLLRNNVGHSFGRNLEKTRKSGLKKIHPTERITADRTTNYQRLLTSTAKAIDKHLLNAHLGEFQILNVYHEMYPDQRKDIQIGIRAMNLKKKIGQSNAPAIPKKFSNELVKYYENL